MDRIITTKRSQLMSRVRNRDTDIEKQLCSILWKNNLRYRKHYKITGRPDIAFPRLKIAIFCDGDFWHGREFVKDGKKYNDFWFEKISQNIKRDRFVTRNLERHGWKVIRFWKNEIKNQTSSCLAIVLKTINEKTELINKISNTSAPNNHNEK
jgi:DNA mismatch endonuclease Vsr